LPDERLQLRASETGADRGLRQQEPAGGAYDVVPVAGEGLQWHAAVGVKKGQDALKAELDRVLDQHPEHPALSVDEAAPSSTPSPSSPEGLIRLGRSLFTSTARTATRRTP
jgi:hypothetical protein